MKKFLLVFLMVGFIFSNGQDGITSQTTQKAVVVAGAPDMVSPLKDEHPDPLPNG
jgi:hypothetical protein